MTTNSRAGVANSAGARLLGLGASGVLVALTAGALLAGLLKVSVIAWVAFGAMAVGTLMGSRAGGTDPRSVVWGYGLASGAMVTSAAIFLVPQSITLGVGAGLPQVGGAGLAGGLIAGYSAHSIGHRLTHLDLSVDVTTAQITAHALSAGLIIGVVYATMPSLGVLLGLAIVSHKGPAGYAAARRLRRQGKSTWVMLVPAAGVGLTAIPAAVVGVPPAPVFNAAVFGFAAGVFLHVAMDFLPVCEAGGEIDQICSLHQQSHRLLDRLRLHAVGSTTLGGVAVVVAWTVLSV